MTSLMALIAKVERHDDDLKELQGQVEELSLLIQQLAEGDQRDREQAERWAAEDREAVKNHEELLPWLDAKLLGYEQRRASPTG